MTTETIPVPDLGGAEEVDVIEICVAVGDRVQAEDSLVVLESDKASMEIPSPRAGRVVAIKLAVGDKVSAGDAMVELELVDEEPSAPSKSEEPAQPSEEPSPAAAVEPPAPAAAATDEGVRVELIEVPDLGTPDAVDVIEISVKAGDTVAEGDSLVVLESDKASMDVPSPKAGVVKEIKVAEGDKVSTGSPLLELEVSAGDSSGAAKSEPEPEVPDSAPAPAPAAGSTPSRPSAMQSDIGPASTAGKRAPRSDAQVYAGPAVRKLVRELGVDLERVPGTGPKGRVLKSDVQAYVQEVMAGRGNLGTGIPAVPEVDFAQFGPVDVQPMSRLHKVTAANMHRSWLNVPHVTQFDEADVTDLEAFRQQLKAEAEARNTRLTPVPLLLKACAVALKAHPRINASLSADGEHVVYKQYVHIGMAVDTPAGLVVPVIRDVDQKSLWELAEETAALAEKARQRKLTPADMQGGGFTVSSLGPIGGQGFTPIVNTPEVAILGVSRLTVKPVWNGSEFAPRKMLPLALSYDHRAVNGGDAGRFMTDLVTLLGDLRRLLL